MSDELVAAEGQAIEAGERIKALMAEPAMQRALRETHERLFQRWQDAGSVEEREAIHSRVAALRDLANAVQVTVDRGAQAQVNREARQRDEDRRREEARRRGHHR